MVFPFAAECSNSYTINRTEVPTFSPSLIKIRPIVNEIKAVKAGRTDRQTDTHTKTDRQIKLGGATVYQTVPINLSLNIFRSYISFHPKF